MPKRSEIRKQRAAVLSRPGRQIRRVVIRTARKTAGLSVRARGKNKVRRTHLATTSSSLTECVQKYATAIAKPFSMEAFGACIPTYPNRPSYKITSVTSGTANVGTAGIGFIAVLPSLCNDYASIWSTTNAFTGTAITVSMQTPTVGVQPTVQPGLPFIRPNLIDGTASSGSSVIGRIVSVGLRMRYTGPVLNQGGRVYLFVDPDHTNLNNSTMAQIGSRMECIKLPVSTDWVETVIFAHDADELEYPVVPIVADATDGEIIRCVYPLSNQEHLTGTGVDTQYGGLPMVAMFDGTVGNSFEWEVVTHVEYIGRLTNAMQTKSHSDIEGLSLVQSAANSMYVRRASRALKKIGKAFYDELLAAASEYRVPLTALSKLIL